MTHMTQAEQILAALESGRRLTPGDALHEFGCMRLGARVYDLERDGYKIDRRFVRRGEAMVSEYWMDTDRRPNRELIEMAKAARGVMV